MKRRRIFALALAIALLALALTGCGSKDNGSAADGDTVTVKLGVVGAIYDDIWKPAQEALKAEGINLEIVQFSDYVTPNNALANGEIDLNAFQHRIYLQGEIANYGYEIQNIGNTFIAPMSLFSSKISSVSELKDGDIIAIPDDLTNGGRALKVLESAGIITLNSAAGFNPTLDDIQTYNIGVTIKELKANVIVSALPDVTAAIVNNNYALDFGLSASDAIFADDRLDIEDYWNLIAARTADLSDPDKVEIFRKVVEAYQTQLVAEFLLVNYHETFFPAFPYDESATFAVTEDNVSEISGYKSSKEGKTVVKIGVCGGVSNNEQWIATQKVLDDEGANIYIELVEFDAYNLPNEALNSGDIDLNAFQHKAYLAKDCGANGYDLTVIGDTLIAPLCIYSEKYDSIDAIKEAAGAK